MSDTLSIFTVTSDCVLANRVRKMRNLLAEIDAQGSEIPLSTGARLPWKAERDTHQFEWRRGHRGWLEMIRSDRKFVQAIIIFQYPRFRLLSFPAKDWKLMLIEAKKLFGKGRSVSTSTKKGKLFEKDGYKILMSYISENKQPRIEIKMAREYFL